MEAMFVIEYSPNRVVSFRLNRMSFLGIGGGPGDRQRLRSYQVHHQELEWKFHAHPRFELA